MGNLGCSGAGENGFEVQGRRLGVDFVALQAFSREVDQSVVMLPLASQPVACAYF